MAKAIIKNRLRKAEQLVFLKKNAKEPEILVVGIMGGKKDEPAIRAFIDAKIAEAKKEAGADWGKYPYLIIDLPKELPLGDPKQRFIN